MNNITIGMNVLQLLLPFVAFGDCVTNIWFITDLILKKIHGEIDSTTVLELAAIAFIA
jgi:hypothetical protein